MSEQARSREGNTEAAWERAWAERYETPVPPPAPRRVSPRHTSLRHLLVASVVLGMTISSIAVARTGDEDAGVGAARGEGDPLALGERNPGSGESTRETAIVANAGTGGLVLRPSNTAKGGRAVSATCDNDGQTEEDGCAVYVNKGTGAAASFRTQGSVPFALRNTNTGLVNHLNSDMVDGKHASEFLGRSERAEDSGRLEGNPASAFLGAASKAADSETLDGQDSSAFLGATAKAADANTLDGKDSGSFARFGGAVFVNGDPAGIGFTSEQTATGIYRVTFPAESFRTATSCKPPTPVVVPHSDVARLATVAIGQATCSGVDGSGGFTVRTFTPDGAAADSAFWFMVM